MQQIRDDDRFIKMIGQIGSTPHEIFEDFVEFLKENHKKIKKELKVFMED